MEPPQRPLSLGTLRGGGRHLGLLPMACTGNTELGSTKVYRVPAWTQCSMEALGIPPRVGW